MKLTNNAIAGNPSLSILNPYEYLENTFDIARLASRVQLDSIPYDRDELSEMSDAQIKRLVRRIVGRKTLSFPYLFTSETAKLIKSNGYQYDLNIVMHLAAASTSGFETCASASSACRASCLTLAGKGRLSGVQIGRIRKTKLLFMHRALFLELMERELAYWTRRAERKNLSLAVRLNGTSDILWEKIAPSIFDRFSGVQFYDYTKHVKRMRLGYGLPVNYDLTFSRTEENEIQCLEVLKAGHNVAIVVDSHTTLERFLEQGHKGFACVDGYSTDRRFADPKGCWVVLVALGEAKNDQSGFVWRQNPRRRLALVA